MNFYRLVAGQIVEERGQPDLLELLRQIGAQSAPAKAKASGDEDEEGDGGDEELDD